MGLVVYGTCEPPVVNFDVWHRPTKKLHTPPLQYWGPLLKLLLNGFKQSFADILKFYSSISSNHFLPQPSTNNHLSGAKSPVPSPLLRRTPPCALRHQPALHLRLSAAQGPSPHMFTGLAVHFLKISYKWAALIITYQ